MKLLPFFLIFLLCGCLVSHQQRRLEYVESKLDLNRNFAQAIINGEVRRGMSPYDVIASWGSPSSIRENSWGDFWVYENYIGRTLGSKYSFVYFDENKRVIEWSVE